MWVQREESAQRWTVDLWQLGTGFRSLCFCIWAVHRTYGSLICPPAWKLQVQRRAANEGHTRPRPRQILPQCTSEGYFTLDASCSLGHPLRPWEWLPWRGLPRPLPSPVDRRAYTLLMASKPKGDGEHLFRSRNSGGRGSSREPTWFSILVLSLTHVCFHPDL